MGSCSLAKGMMVDRSQLSIHTSHIYILRTQYPHYMRMWQMIHCRPYHSWINYCRGGVAWTALCSWARLRFSSELWFSGQQASLCQRLQ